MKSTGITRRIDELGRIVIPKELRKNMHIKSGELLEIYLSNEDTLILKKYNIIKKDNILLEKIIKTITRKMDINIFITDFNKIIFTNKKELKNNFVSDDFDIKKNISTFPLTKEYIIKKPYSHYNLNVNEELIGYIFFEYPSKQIGKEIEKILVNIIENCLENK